MRYFLGVDVGASKTHALVVDELGQSIGFGQAGGGNYQSVGYEGLADALLTSCETAFKTAGVENVQMTGAGFGVAGYDFPSDRPAHMEIISRLGLACPVEIVNDGLNGLFAGATRGIGVNVTAGTSNNCRGRNAAGREGRIVGNGATFGEYGGAMEIVQRGLQMVNYAWIRRIPTTALTGIYLHAIGARDELDLMEGLSNNRYDLSPALAYSIAQAAKSGDAAAREVITWAGVELGWLAVAVARQLDLQDADFEIIQSGSVFEAGDLVTQPMRQVVQARCPRARLRRLRGLPVVGAVILGMEQAGFDGYAVRDAIIDSAERIST